MAVDTGIIARIQAEAAASDVEICGALVGGPGGVREAWPLANQSGDGRSHYRIPAAVVLRTERAAEARGLRVMGFYHSHPSGGAMPSRTDLELAVPGYIYLIIGGNGESRVWRLREDRSGFDELAFPA